MLNALRKGLDAPTAVQCCQLGQSSTSGGAVGSSQALGTKALSKK